MTGLVIQTPLLMSRRQLWPDIAVVDWWPNASVICFEPQKESMKADSLRPVGPDNITIVPKAAGNKSAKGGFLHDVSSGLSGQQGQYVDEDSIRSASSKTAQSSWKPIPGSSIITGLWNRTPLRVLKQQHLKGYHSKSYPGFEPEVLEGRESGCPSSRS